MKKIFPLIFIIAVIGFIAGCGSKSDEMSSKQDDVAKEITEGELKEELFDNGKTHKRGHWVLNNEGDEVKNGLHEVWHENGKKEGEYRYQYGVNHGMTVRWHDNGQKAFECNFINGKPDVNSSKQWGYNGEEIDFRQFF